MQSVLLPRLPSKKAETITNAADYVVKTVDKKVVLNFTPTGWDATSRAASEYIVKKKFQNPTTWTANNTEDHRSYWAEGVNYDKDFEDYYKDGSTTSLLDYTLLKDLQTGGGRMMNIGEHNAETADIDKIYVREHTSKLQMGKDANGVATGAENIIANTYVLIVGNYTINEKEGGKDIISSYTDGTHQLLSYSLGL